MENSILIFSESRGGSTWLLELLKHIPSTCINWEPLHIRLGTVPKKFNWGWIPKIDDISPTSETLDYLEKTITLKRRSRWTTKYLSFHEIFFSKKVITKFVRANRILVPFVKDLRLKHPPIVLLRHPIDTCFSQIKAFGFSKEGLQIDGRSSNEHFEFLAALNTELEIQTAIWCINNVPMINQFDKIKDKVIVTFYSDLILNPKHEIQRIFNELNLRNIPNIDKIDFKKPSKTNIDSSLIKDPKRQLMKNIDSLSNDEKLSIQNIFDHFGLTLFNAFSPFPEKANLV